MALICNRQPEPPPESPPESPILTKQQKSKFGRAETVSEASLYLDNERYIEAGSAYF